MREKNGKTEAEAKQRERGWKGLEDRKEKRTRQTKTLRERERQKQREEGKQTMGKGQSEWIKKMWHRHTMEYYSAI